MAENTPPFTVPFPWRSSTSLDPEPPRYCASLLETKPRLSPVFPPLQVAPFAALYDCPPASWLAFFAKSTTGCSELFGKLLHQPCSLDYPSPPTQCPTRAATMLLIAAIWMLTSPARATEMDVTMIGLQNAGKTSLLRVLSVRAHAQPIHIATGADTNMPTGWRVHDRVSALFLVHLRGTINLSATSSSSPLGPASLYCS